MQIRMDKENRELKAHGSYEFPVNISYEQLSRYERGSFSWHWHLIRQEHCLPMPYKNHE